MKYRLYIGIDPDVEKSGFAAWGVSTGGLHLKNLDLTDLFAELDRLAEMWDIMVHIEAGWQIRKTNWHRINGAIGVNEKMASAIGANHEIGKQIGKFCDKKGYWKLFVNPMGKMTALQFRKITGYELRTNQEQRDAAQLLFSRMF